MKKIKLFLYCYYVHFLAFPYFFWQELFSLSPFDLETSYLTLVYYCRKSRAQSGACMPGRLMFSSALVKSYFHSFPKVLEISSSYC